MAFQSVPQTAKIEVNFLKDGVVMQNVLYARRATGYNQSQLSTLAAAVDAWVDDEYLDGVTAEFAYTGVVVTGQENENDYQVSSAIFAGNGTNGGASLPNNVTKAITLDTGLTGRSARGRMFVIGAPKEGLTGDENHWSTGAIDDFKDLIDTLIDVLDAIGWVLVVVSRFVNGVKRVTAQTTPVLSGQVSNSTTDSARYRLPKT